MIGSTTTMLLRHLVTPTISKNTCWICHKQVLSHNAVWYKAYHTCRMEHSNRTTKQQHDTTQKSFGQPHKLHDKDTVKTKVPLLRCHSTAQHIARTLKPYYSQTPTLVFEAFPGNTKCLGVFEP